MQGQHCKLYDENLVRNIMISTGLTVFEYLKQNRKSSIGEMCEFVELNADSIIENTIVDMNRTPESREESALEGDEPWLDDDQEPPHP